MLTASGTDGKRHEIGIYRRDRESGGCQGPRDVDKDEVLCWQCWFCAVTTR